MPFFSNSGSSGSGDGGLPVLSGTTAPSNSLGVDGQIYIDTAAEVFYGPKTAGSWGSGIPFGSASYLDLTNVPTTFPPESHTHAVADVSGLQATLDTFVTSADVSAQISGLADTAPETLNTLAELAAALGDDPNFATTITNQIAGKADASHTHAIADVTSLQDTLDAKASGTHSHTKSDVTDLATSDLDLAGNRCLFANYYASQADFPSATTYHGGIAHSHADGAIFFAHSGAWTRLANQSELPDPGLQWSTVPASETATGTAGEIAYDETNFYVCVSSNLWKKSPLLAFDTGGGGDGTYQIVITSQPSSGSAQSGTFVVSAEGYLPTGETISYQWQQSVDGGTSWQDIELATSSVYQLSGLTTSDSGTKYRAVLSSQNASTVYTSAATVTVVDSGVSGVTLNAPTIVHPASTNAGSAWQFTITADNIDVGTTGYSAVLYEYQYELSQTNGYAFEDISSVTSSKYATAFPLVDNQYQVGVAVGTIAYGGENAWTTGNFLPTMRARGRYRLERTVNGTPEQIQTDWSPWSVARSGNASVSNIILSGQTQFLTHPSGGTADLSAAFGATAFSTSATISGSTKRYRWATGQSESNLTYQPLYTNQYSLIQPVHLSSVGTKKLWCIGAADYQIGSISAPATLVVPFSDLDSDYRQTSVDSISINGFIVYNYGLESIKLVPELSILGTIFTGEGTGGGADPDWQLLTNQTSGQVATITAGNLNVRLERSNSYGSDSVSWALRKSWLAPIDTVTSGGTLGVFQSEEYGWNYRATCRLENATLNFMGKEFTGIYTVWANWDYF